MSVCKYKELYYIYVYMQTVYMRMYYIYEDTRICNLCRCITYVLICKCAACMIRGFMTHEWGMCTVCTYWN